MTNESVQQENTFSYGFLDKYFAGVEKGICPLYSVEEIDAILDAHFFSGEAIIELTKKEKMLLRQGIMDDYGELFGKSHSFLRQIALRQMVHLQGSASRAFHQAHKNYCSDKSLLIDVASRPDLMDYFHKKNIQPMTATEKVAFLKNLPAYLDARFICGFSESPCPSRGYRLLSEYGYDMESLLREVRSGTGRKQVRVLDVGGGVGSAMVDLKEMDSDVCAINLTLDFEPAMFRVDRTILGFAERFPADLRESVDLVISNMAFRYFRFPDLVVKNIVYSLSVGGVADVFVATEKSETNQSELKRRLTETYQWLMNLVEQKVLAIEFSTGYILNIPLEAGESLYPCRGLYIRKLAAMT